LRAATTETPIDEEVVVLIVKLDEWRLDCIVVRQSMDRGIGAKSGSSGSSVGFVASAMAEVFLPKDDTE
jgi:hypothetical protein